MFNEPQTPEFEPWRRYPSLTAERLTTIADIIRNVRHEAVIQHDIARGDSNWGLGCRVYERTCFALRRSAEKHPNWLIILPETRGLQFSFAIENVPFRFYRGTPEDPPDRYRICTFGELHHQQLCLQLDSGWRPPDGVLRIAVETSPATLEVATVSVVEVDDAGNPIGRYIVPTRQRRTRKVEIIQVKPVELAPPQIEPLTNIEEVGDAQSDAGAENKNTKADTGS